MNGGGLMNQMPAPATAPMASAYIDSEPIYTPRILRNHDEASPRSNPQVQFSQQMQTNRQQQQHLHHNMFGSVQQNLNPMFDATPASQASNLNQQPPMLQQFNPGFNPQQPQTILSPPGGSPTKVNGRRPSQPPPAPPPGGALSPTRAQRESLPPPPPPPASGVEDFRNGLNRSPPKASPVVTTSMDDSLPPPPPVPTADPSSLGVKIPMEHLPPSPPPPPPVPVTTAAAATSVPVTSAPSDAPAPPPGPAPPPPPPPPPADLMNGHSASDNHASPKKSLAAAILAAPELKKTPAQPSFVPPQDNMRSDLLKAIRDGNYVFYVDIFFVENSSRFLIFFFLEIIFCFVASEIFRQIAAT